MNTNALRQKILDLAIHGKLVKQDPADEPASVMLEKIRAEKEAKIAAGEIKRNKNDSYIFKYTGTSGENKTDNNPEGLEHNRHYEKFADGRLKDIEDEIPFAVPEGWAWCKTKQLYNIRSAIRIHQTDWQNEGIPFFRGRELIELCKTGKVHPEIFISESLYEENKEKGGVPQKNDLLVSAVGTLGFVHIVEGSKKFYYKDAYILCFENHFNLNPKYTKFVIESNYTQKVIYNGSKGTTVEQLTIENAKDLWFPFPPVKEQHRIVTAIEAIFTQIDLLEQNKVDLQTAVKQAKSKILDLAIHGKLVPQDPADEPAFVMLERLRAEKEAKIAAGEMKRGKNDSYIYKNSTDNCYYQKYTDGCEENISDEIPFDVPDGWTWCRLPEVCRKPITDGTHNSPSNSASGDFLYITAKNIKNLEICLDDATYISKEIHESIYSRCSPELNDILLTKDGTIGEVAVNNLNYPFSMLSSVALIKPSNEILSWFLAYILISDLLQNKMKKDAKGSALKRIILAQINDFLIPLPPLAEQQRIVTKIEELFAQLDFIMTALVD